MEPTRRRPRPIQIGLLAVAVVLAVVVGDRLDGSSPADTAREPAREPSASASSPSPSRTPEALLSGLTTPANAGLSRCEPNTEGLATCGPAPALRGLTRWFNTEDGAPLRLRDLRGQVVLLDFFAYSCGSCRRDQTYLTDWARQYADSGLRVVGVQSPHWDFEADAGNVAAAVRDLGIDYPVALDPQRRAFGDYRGRYFPSKYLIDAEGRVSAISVGSGGYERTETQIRDLLREARPEQKLPERTFLQTSFDDGQAAEIGFGYASAPKFVGRPAEVVVDRPATYVGADDVDPSMFSLDGQWTVGRQSIEAGRGASVTVGIAAMRASLVVAGRGTIVVRERDRPDRRITVDGRPGAITLFTGRLDLGPPVTIRASPGLRFYAVEIR